MASGAGGIAIGVHTTQFQIRDPKINLYHKVLQLAIEEIEKADLHRPFIKVAGVTGNNEQVVNEAKICAELGLCKRLPAEKRNIKSSAANADVPSGLSL